jgi:hypothetical protein
MRSRKPLVGDVVVPIKTGVAAAVAAVAPVVTVDVVDTFAGVLQNLHLLKNTTAINNSDMKARKPIILNKFIVINKTGFRPVS